MFNGSLVLHIFWSLNTNVGLPGDFGDLLPKLCNLRHVSAAKNLQNLFIVTF